MMQASGPEEADPAAVQTAVAIGPADPPQEPMTLTAGLLEQAAQNYDQVSGGKWEEHRSALQQRGDAQAWSARYPLAWALARMSARLREPGFTLFGEPDVAACVHIAAFRQFVACWSRVVRFSDLCASAAADGFSLPALTLFAAAQRLVTSGNPGAFMGPDAASRIRGLLIGDGGPGSLTATVQPLPAELHWPVLKPATLGALQFAVQDALAAAQGLVNAKRPGIVVLAGGIMPSNIDQPLVDAINAVLRKQGRRHRGLVAIVAMLPKLIPTERPDQVGFGWSFYPLANPHLQGEHAVRIGERRDHRGFAAPPSEAR